MNSHKYILAPYNGRTSRLKCPDCGKAHELAPYFDTETGEILADHVGRCNRENNCGYHYTPKQYFADGGKMPESNQFNQDKPVEPPKPIDFLPFEYLESTCKHYLNNNFYLYLKSLFGKEVAIDLCRTYFIGTSAYWKGSTIFWQIDVEGNVRQCKIMLYNPVTGKRVRLGAMVDRYNRITKQYETITADQDCTKVNGKYLDDSTKNLNLQQCFFGEHLLAEHPDKTVCIVESEKTALIASIYKPEYIWLATGGKYGCKWADYEVNKVLQGRKVIMWPDAYLPKPDPKTGKIKPSPFEVWSERARTIEWQAKCKIYVSDLLGKIATTEQKREGWDLLDYLLIKDETAGLALTGEGYPVIWDFKTA